MWMIQINKFDSYKIDLKKQKLRFRLQFKYLESKDLKGRDEEAYKYYLKQVTSDLHVKFLRNISQKFLFKGT